MFIFFLDITSRFRAYNPYTPFCFFNKMRTPKCSEYKSAIHRLELLLLSESNCKIQLPSSSHLEFNPLILSPKTVQG